MKTKNHNNNDVKQIQYIKINIDHHAMSFRANARNLKLLN